MVKFKRQTEHNLRRREQNIDEIVKDTDTTMPALKLTLNFDGLSPTLLAGTTGIKCLGVLCSHTVSKQQFC